MARVHGHQMPRKPAPLHLHTYHGLGVAACSSYIGGPYLSYLFDSYQTRDREIQILTEAQGELRRQLRALKADYVSTDAEDVIRALRKRLGKATDQVNDRRNCLRSSQREKHANGRKWLDHVQGPPLLLLRSQDYLRRSRHLETPPITLHCRPNTATRLTSDVNF